MFSDYPDMMSVDEVMGALRIGRSKAYMLIKTGEIRAFKIGQSIRIPKTCLLAYVEGKSYNVVESR